MAPAWSKEFLDIHASIECRFTLKLVRDMIITYIPNIFIFSMFIYKGCLKITRVKKLFFATAALNARLKIFFYLQKIIFPQTWKSLTSSTLLYISSYTSAYFFWFLGSVKRSFVHFRRLETSSRQLFLVKWQYN